MILTFKRIYPINFISWNDLLKVECSCQWHFSNLRLTWIAFLRKFHHCNKSILKQNGKTTRQSMGIKLLKYETYKKAQYIVPSPHFSWKSLSNWRMAENIRHYVRITVSRTYLQYNIIFVQIHIFMKYKSINKIETLIIRNESNFLNCILFNTPIRTVNFADLFSNDGYNILPI